MSASDSERNRVIFASVIASCWKDQEYRDRFIADPNGVCLSEGIVVPEGVRFVVKEIILRLRILCCRLRMLVRRSISSQRF